MAIVKTIAAFANAKGGTLIIGVNDDGKPVGLDKDLALMSKPDVDRYSYAQGKMNDALGARDVLCVSQFTLYGDASGGNRPSFVAAARPELAEPLYDRFCDRLGAARGVFGARMAVSLVNDGPVTLVLEA
ncbi:D-aminoacyl-tRNA deacylase [soil metagenome]